MESKTALHPVPRFYIFGQHHRGNGYVVENERTLVADYRSVDKSRVARVYCTIAKDCVFEIEFHSFPRQPILTIRLDCDLTNSTASTPLAIAVLAASWINSSMLWHVPCENDKPGLPSTWIETI